MGYERPRWITPLALAFVGLPVVAIAFHSNRDRLQEWYVERAVRECAASTGLGKVSWANPMTFDWELREFHPQDEVGLATLDCIDRKAGWALDWREESRFARPMLQVAIGGSHHAPPERIYRVGLVKNVIATRR